jgi:hypothetical protein
MENQQQVEQQDREFFSKLGLKPVVFLLVALLVVTSAIAAYEYNTAISLRKEIHVSIFTSFSKIEDGLQLSITLQEEKTQYSAGEIAPITFTITNVSNQTLAFTDLNGNATFNFQIFNGTNTEVYSWIYGAYPQSNSTVPLGPGGNYAETLNWDTENNFFVSQITSGTYSIVGELGGFPPYQLQTAPLKVTITNS